MSFFTPNCTTPPPGTNFVTNSQVRGTLDILWSSLSIIILCTWTILHMNVPRMRPAAGFWKSFWWTILDSRTKIKWMLLAMLAPEWTFTIAVNALVSAHGTRFWSNTRGNDRPVRNHLANMGYFVLDWGDAAMGDDVGAMNEDMQRASRFFRAIQSHIGPRLRRKVSEPDDINARRLKGRFWSLTASQWSVLEGMGVASLPDIPEHHLERLDCSSGLVKLLAIIQILWLCVQLLVRRVQDQPSCQLEIAALAFAAQSGITYLCYWTKPRDVETMHFVKVEKFPLEVEVNKDFLVQVEKLIESGPLYFMMKDTRDSQYDPQTGPPPIHNDAIHLTANIKHLDEAIMKTSLSTITVLTLSGAVFGGLHCLAWFSHFPTSIERDLWRACSILTAVLPGALVLCAMIVQKFFSSVVFSVITGMYVLARLYLIVEMFRTLFYLPPEVFGDTWPSNFPHFG